MMWGLVLLAALVAGGNGFFWGLFVQAAIEVQPERRPYGRMIDLPRDEWRRL